jgi:RNA polymerase sigma-70 factor (ECF subfamily)
MLQQRELDRDANVGLAAFDGWYRRHCPAIERYCARVLRDPGAGADVAQEVFFRAWLNADLYETEEHLRRWAFVVARNLCLDMMTMRTRFVPSSRFDDRPEPAPDVIDGRLAELQDAMRRLSTRHRALLVLRYWAELSNEGVAAKMGLSLPTTRVALHRARSALRRELTAEH